MSRDWDPPTASLKLTEGKSGTTPLCPKLCLLRTTVLCSVLIMLLIGNKAFAEDSLQVPDSLIWPGETLGINADSALSRGDSSGVVTRWVYPLGLMAAAVAGIYALFAVRSR